MRVEALASRRGPLARLQEPEKKEAHAVRCSGPTRHSWTRVRDAALHRHKSGRFRSQQRRTLENVAALQALGHTRTAKPDGQWGQQDRTRAEQQGEKRNRLRTWDPTRGRLLTRQPSKQGEGSWRRAAPQRRHTSNRADEEDGEAAGDTGNARFVASTNRASSTPLSGARVHVSVFLERGRTIARCWFDVIKQRRQGDTNSDYHPFLALVPLAGLALVHLSAAHWMAKKMSHVTRFSTDPKHTTHAHSTTAWEPEAQTVSADKKTPPAVTVEHLGELEL